MYHILLYGLCPSSCVQIGFVITSLKNGRRTKPLKYTHLIPHSILCLKPPLHSLCIKYKTRNKKQKPSHQSGRTVAHLGCTLFCTQLLYGTQQVGSTKVEGLWEITAKFWYLKLSKGARGGADGWGTALQTGRLRVRFPMVSLEFFIDKILPAAPLPWGWLSF